MRTLEIRRHSLTKRGPGRGSGSHLSQEGVALARHIGADIGPFDRVYASPIPRTAETAIAMGFAVDDLLDALGPSDPDLYAEIGHHDRWSWDSPFATFAHLVQQNGPTTRLAHLTADALQTILTSLPDGGRALAISHGRVIESALVALFPTADFASWGPPFHHLEGARITVAGNSDAQTEILRVGQPH